MAHFPDVNRVPSFDNEVIPETPDDENQSSDMEFESDFVPQNILDKAN